MLKSFLVHNDFYLNVIHCNHKRFTISVLTHLYLGVKKYSVFEKAVILFVQARSDLSDVLHGNRV